MRIFADMGRMPFGNPVGKVQIAMIGHSKNMGYSGSGAALVKWAGPPKFMMLTVVCRNMLVTP